MGLVLTWSLRLLEKLVTDTKEEVHKELATKGDIADSEYIMGTEEAWI